MHTELDLDGVFLSNVVATALLAIIATMLLRGLLAKTGLYRRIWHPALFDAAAFVLLWAAIIALPLGN